MIIHIATLIPGDWMLIHMTTLIPGGWIVKKKDEHRVDTLGSA